VYYELDLGLNHTVRKWAQPIDYTANMLIPLPGGRDGPSGVLVCSENYITWVHPTFTSHRIPIPHRPATYDNNGADHQPSRTGSLHKVLVSSYVVHKMKKSFFVLVQTDVHCLVFINYSRLVIFLK
jgi:splicing factor 3B subunit 3